MIPHVGIDLGTTFSCLSYIDEEGVPVVIKNSDGQESTPSVVWFDGKVAYVGKKANDRKLLANSPIFEFVKRDIGNNVPSKYVVNGYDYGATGLSAILLKKMKLEAFYFFKRKGWIPQDATPQNTLIPAAISVPAYFRDKKRKETKKAGVAAGFDVIGIVNEPTAAALTYGLNLVKPQRVLVFDLGGGTFDATILELGANEANVIATDGADEIGGKDWDKIIRDYLFAEFERQTSLEVPDDLGWEMQRHANESKIVLTDEMKATVFLNAGAEMVEVTLNRERSQGSDSLMDAIVVFDELEMPAFYFEERSQDLLAVCRAILHNMLEKSGFTWNDIDEIVLAGGSSRMPMVPKMLEQISGKKVKRSIEGYNYDTAIAQGAALYVRNRDKVVDVASKSVGIKVKQGEKFLIDYLIRKNQSLPVFHLEEFEAVENARLEVFEGEDSTDPLHATKRGELRIINPAGKVKVGLSLDEFGVIEATVFAHGKTSALVIRSEENEVEVSELKRRIDEIEVRL